MRKMIATLCGKNLVEKRKWKLKPSRTSSDEHRERKRRLFCYCGCVALAGFVGVLLALLGLGHAKGHPKKPLGALSSNVSGDYMGANLAVENGTTHQPNGARRSAVSTEEVDNATEFFLFALNVD
ncbi:hypothetical protein HPB48_026020 [Haemaphysalis longicornis]|uniref:Uncharacterized protein n=1 Tax=Haemaphysalis longicornis TaxID=44386 RepID=A0A9J6HBB0_HAELO|nr:hypothetical protein HPB48_026020 [Haemaphysalis longicornis]